MEPLLLGFAMIVVWWIAWFGSRYWSIRKRGEAIEDDREDYQRRLEAASQLLCPVILFNDYEKNRYRSTSFHGEKNKELNLSGSVVTETGPGRDANKRVDPSRIDIFPGDVNIHYEFLQGNTLEKKPENIPTLQIHKYDITRDRRSEKPIFAEDVYYLSFFLPELCFQEIIVGTPRNG